MANGYNQEEQKRHLMAGVYFCLIESGGVAVWHRKVLNQ